MGSFPVVECDDDGTIATVTEFGSTFTESAGVSFFGGIMIPGFIAYIKHDTTFDAGLVRRLNINGFLRFAYGGSSDILSDDVVQSVDYDGDAPMESVIPRFSGKSELERCLMELTSLRVAGLNIVRPWGVLKPGYRPGIIVMEGVNLRTFEWSPSIRFRILVR